MEDILKGKKGRYTLIIFVVLGLFAPVFLYFLFPAPIPKEKSYENVSPYEASHEEAAEREATLLFVGDVMLSRAVGSVMARTENWKYPFLLIAHFLESADLTFGNLEGLISSSGVKVGSIYSFRADPKVVEGLWFTPGLTSCQSLITIFGITEKKRL